VKLSKGETLWFIHDERRQMGRENKEVGAMPTYYRQTLFAASHVFQTFSVFEVVYNEHPFAVSPSAMSVMP